MGLPQIVTDKNGSREIIIEGENRIIVHSKSVDDLYNTMKCMLNDNFRYSLAVNAYRLIALRY